MTKNVLFSPIASSRLSDEAKRQIRNLIETGVLKPGDRLPSERELQEQFSVSRASIREALRSLEALGFVKVQPGVGAFVTNYDDQNDLKRKWTQWMAEHQDQVNELLEVREALESKAAFVAAQKISDDLLETLFETLERMERCAELGDVESAVQADIDFHDLISKATRNHFLIQLNDSVNYLLIESRYAYFQASQNILASCKQHRRVAEALEKHDPEAAARAMLQHVRKTKRAMLQVPDADQKLESQSGS